MTPSWLQTLQYGTHRLRLAVKLALDALLAGLSWMIVFDLIRDVPSSWIQVGTWVTLAVGCGLLLRLPRQHYRMFGDEDMIRVVVAGLASFVVGAIAFHLLHWIDSPGVLLMLAVSSLFSSLFWLCLRLVVRVACDSRSRFLPWRTRPTATRTVIVGAGRAGLLMDQELRRHPELGCHVVGYLDDAPDKQGLNIQGTPVLGPTSQLETLLRAHDAQRVIIALPSASGERIRALSSRIRCAGVELKTVPALFEMLGNRSWHPEIRDVCIEDLLRREPIQLDRTALALALKDRTVLITGGGGSIGSEIARQLAPFAPRALILLGRGEHSLWQAERDLRQAFPGLPVHIELCDIRQRHRLTQVFLRWQPDVVFHAAAHKHVPFLEAHPEEGVENNILGTHQVLEAALEAGTRTFVNISTDKAVNPASILGVTKWMAEQLVRAGAARALPGSHYVSVRFGNVLGSRGSVIPLFREQIMKGGPVTITDPRMTRYFMTLQEASQLVLQAGLLGRTGSVYVLDMGEPVRILDLARDMITLSGLRPNHDIRIECTGIRPGEKLFEELFNPQEACHTRMHDKILSAELEALGPAALEGALAVLRRVLLVEDEALRQRAILEVFQRMSEAYRPPRNPVGLGRFVTQEAPRSTLLMDLSPEAHFA